MTLAYFDCPAGVAGDMILGALVDAGWPVAELRAVVTGLGLGDFVTIQAQRVRRGPLVATAVQVDCHQAAPPQRHLADVLAILAASRLPAAITADAARVFQRLAEAEAMVHGTAVEEVHFHEVGALDAIVDIAGAVAGLAALGVTAVHASPLPAGSGWTGSLHGPIPVPAPATLALLAAAGAPVAAPAAGVDLAGELVTPTGAALLTTLATFSRPAMTLARVAHGAGGRDTPWPNVVRLWLGEAVPAAAGDFVLLETNIDDMVPELYGHVTERLFEAGALDVWLTATQMKKGRPGTVLSVLAPGPLEGALAALLLAETTTLGVRVQPVRRHEAAREVRFVATDFGHVAVKVKLTDGQVVGWAPEYEACRAVARERDVPLTQVYGAVQAAAARAATDGGWLVLTA